MYVQIMKDLLFQFWNKLTAYIQTYFIFLYCLTLSTNWILHIYIFTSLLIFENKTHTLVSDHRLSRFLRGWEGRAIFKHIRTKRSLSTEYSLDLFPFTHHNGCLCLYAGVCTLNTALLYAMRRGDDLGA